MMRWLLLFALLLPGAAQAHWATCATLPTLYGARGDDSADDSAAFQSAINDLPAGGGVVCIPPGRYIINTPLTDGGTRYNITLRGMGSSGWGAAADNVGLTRLVTTGAGPIISFGPEAGNGSIPGGVQIEDIAFLDESASKNSAGAILIKRHQHVRILRINCADFQQGYCIKFDGTGTFADAVQYGYLEDVHARNTQKGILADGGSMQFVVMGGHFTAPASPNYTNSVCIRLNAGTASRADTWRIINPSCESYKIGVDLIGTLAVNLQVRIENTSGISYHDATCIKIAGTADFTARANTVIGSSLNGCATGIDVGTLATENTFTANSIVDVTDKLNCNAAITLDNIADGVDLVNSGSGTGCVRRSWSQAFPSGTCVQGSTHQRSSGTGTAFYVCQNSAWVGK